MTAVGAPPSVSRLHLSQRVLGFFAAENQALLAVALLGLVNQLHEPVGPPEPVNRGLALGLVYALPAVVGGLGALTGRRSLLAAAAVACAVGSVLSFSGITLLFLIPAVLFAFAAVAPGRTMTALRAGEAPAGATTSPEAVTAPGPDAAPRAGRDWFGAIRGLALAIVLVALMVGSGLALLALTEPRCWIGEEGPTGTIAYRIVPDISGVSLAKGESAGCSSADLTLRGGIVATVLGLGALGLAIRAARPPRQRDPLDDRAGPEPVSDAEITT